MLIQKNTPFRRVKDEEIDVSPNLANNSFEAKVNAWKLCIMKNSGHLPVQNHFTKKNNNNKQEIIFKRNKKLN